MDDVIILIVAAFAVIAGLAICSGDDDDFMMRMLKVTWQDRFRVWLKKRFGHAD